MRITRFRLQPQLSLGALIFSFLLEGALLAADNPLALPQVGSSTLTLLSPTMLELGLVTTKLPPPARLTQWDFVTADLQLRPSVADFAVSVNGQPVTVQALGFRRRPLYAPFKKRDLRIGNYLYLQLATPAQNWQLVEVRNPGGKIWPTNAPSAVFADPLRLSPAIHVSQVGYLPAYSKVGTVGYYLGSLGEMNVASDQGFQVIDAVSRQTVFNGNLVIRRDVGYQYSPLPYQRVLEADFSGLSQPGEYRLVVPGVGASLPFRIDDGIAACFARTYALGLYHQRCGAANELPFTRHVHGACHLAKAEVPNMGFSAVNKELAEFSKDYKTNPRHTAPQLKDINSSRYPFVNTAKLDVSGGHHDAGDYSKYTINVAQFIHALVFAVDAVPGVAALDNLGLPESGDGVSDLLQQAKWESDFLAKLQDEDGGFYFLVYPRNRAYEDNVLPDRGDPQVVFPKNTAATAAAVAALAQTASSPLFKRLYPDTAATYMSKALKGWAFLQQAMTQFGRDGAYQRLSHYGDEFMHDDELAWAATELFAATGDPSYQSEVISRFDPNDRNTRRFTWWRLFEGYGCAIRSYAFAARSGRLSPDQLAPGFLAKCEAELLIGADDQVRFARENAYGSSFPDPNKSFRSAGWYFSVEHTFDIMAAYQLQPKKEYLDAVLSNMSYEAGGNPVNVTFVSGLGWKRQREIVHQYAQNDRRALPQSGIPLGNLQTGFPSLSLYPAELPGLCFPSDFAGSAPYAPYDVWGDTYNTVTEVVTAQQARSLASMAWLMAQTPAATQPWKSAAGYIATRVPGLPIGFTNSATFTADGLDLGNAQIVWEGRNQEPTFGAVYRVSPSFLGPQWIEAEALLPDGRRVFGVSSFEAVAGHPVTVLSPGHLRVAGVAGQNFVLEGSMDLKEWTPLATDTFLFDSYEFIDPAPGDRRFYRAVAAP